jgi:ATP-dependent DNA helicase DinG
VRRGDSRFTPTAARRLADAIRAAGGVEVFAVGKIDSEGLVADVDIHCRGDAGSVPALLSRPRPGDVVIHNHPSGNLTPSEPDMALAGRFGEDGVGFIIVSNDAARANWVVEPFKRPIVRLDEEAVIDFFTGTLPRHIPGYEARPGQLDMARAVTQALNGDEIAVLEAGTGTGKSLAYLVPAVLWAKADEAKVVVATFTLTLQGQLEASDLPVLTRGGLDFRHAVLKGRSNYLCRRRLAETVAELQGDPQERLQGAGQDPRARLFADLARWAEVSATGTRQDSTLPLDEDDWERVASDHDQTLRARCPHYNRCFYYEARRKAADAHLLVVNHHLMLADLVLKKELAGEGILPRFDRLIVDEGHHLEDTATSLFQERVTSRMLRRTLAPLLPRDKRPGAIATLGERFGKPGAPLPRPEKVRQLSAELRPLLVDLQATARGWLEQLRVDALSAEQRSLRITAELRQGELWQRQLAPTLAEAAQRTGAVALKLALLQEELEELPPAERAAEPQPLFDLARAGRRLAEMSQTFGKFLAEDEGTVRWIEEARDKSAPAPAAALVLAPIEVAPLLRERVFEPLRTTVVSSATLTIRGEFDHWLEQVGMGQPAGPPRALSTGLFPSPFDYNRQALLAIPRDLPDPDDPRYEEEAARVLIEALKVTGGGAFVLCTSYALLGRLHQRAEAALGHQMLMLKHGALGRDRLLQRFREHRNAVLFGTDSFWEGVSVAGEALRLVVIPRLPFRVPTEPVAQARTELAAARGQDPFRARALPEAVLRLRQGFGRLIRTATDRGAVMILDRRVIDRWYGRIFLASLPELPRVTGPTPAVMEALRRFYADKGGPVDKADPRR